MASFLARAIPSVAKVARWSSLPVRAAHTSTIYTYLNYRDRYVYIGEREVNAAFDTLADYKSYLGKFQAEDYKAGKGAMQIKQSGTEIDPIPIPAEAGPFPYKVFMKELTALEEKYTGKDAESSIMKEVTAKWTDEMSFNHVHEDGLLYGVVAVRATKKVDQEDLTHFMHDQTTNERMASGHQCIQELYIQKPGWNKY